MPRIHPRTQQVTQPAEHTLREVISKWSLDHDLTTTEELTILNRVAGDHIGTCLKYALRHERHGELDYSETKEEGDAHE